jgi:hypothetical protein
VASLAALAPAWLRGACGHDNGRMGAEIVDEAVRATPAARLRGLVGWYSGYRQRGVPPSRHRGLPSPWLTLILTLDEPLSMAAHPDPAAAPGDYPTLVG